MRLSFVSARRAQKIKVTQCFMRGLPIVQGGSNMTGTDLYVNKPHCAAAVRP